MTEPEFTFGGPCPPIKPIFFPNDPKEEPREIGGEDEQADAPQPA